MPSRFVDEHARPALVVGDADGHVAQDPVIICIHASGRNGFAWQGAALPIVVPATAADVNWVVGMGYPHDSKQDVQLGLITVVQQCEHKAIPWVID